MRIASLIRSLWLLVAAAQVSAQWEGGTPAPPNTAPLNNLPPTQGTPTQTFPPSNTLPPFNQGFSPTPATQPAQGGDTAALASEIIAGEVIGFLNETNPTAEELNCIKFGASEIARAVVSTSEHLVKLLQQMFGNGGVPNGRRLLPPGEEGGGTADMIPDVKQSMLDVMNMVKGRTFDCLHQEGINDFKVAAEHLSDLHFMEQSLLANGAEVSYELTSAIKAWQAKKYSLFGGYLGQVWRRILLGGPHHAGMVPPPDFAIQQMTNGMLQGFFGSGFFMRVEGVGTTAGAANDVKISLHNCIAENLMFFRSSWSAVAGLMGGLKSEMKGVKLTPEQQKAAGKKEQAAIASALISLPGAMSRCTSSTGQRVKLGEVAEAFEDGRVSLALPQRSTKAIDLSVDLTAALQKWDQHDYAGFGFRLGRLLQRVALLAFPQKYSVDESGSLMRRLGDFSKTPATMASLGSIAPTLGAAALFISVVGVGMWTQRRKAYGVRSRVAQEEPLQDSQEPADTEFGSIE
jgi:hypothetical protein